MDRCAILHYLVMDRKVLFPFLSFAFGCRALFPINKGPLDPAYGGRFGLKTGAVC